MIENSIFNQYKKFFEELIAKKQESDTLPEDDESLKIKKYELNSQLFLIRDYSALKIIFENSEIKSRVYKFKWRLQTIDEKLNIFKIKMMTKSHYQTNYQIDYLYLIISEKNKFILPIGFIKSMDFDKRIVGFFKEFFPNISISFLSQTEIKKILYYYIKEKDFLYRLKPLIYRKTTEKKGRPARRPYQRAIDYIEEDIFSKISELETNEKYIDTMGLYLTDIKNKEEFKFLYNRYNKILWYSGISEYFTKFLDLLYNVSVNKFNFLDKRERKYTENHKSKPIVLKLNKAIFANKGAIEKFEIKINDFPKCNYAIIQSGNPYLHIILRDQEDDSTYSIKNLSNRDLMICPQIIGSNSSMLKILDLIAGRISEFEVLDYDKYKRDFHEQYNNK